MNHTEKPRTTDQQELKAVRKDGLDKFYTLPSFSKKCIDKVFEYYDITDFDLIIEPSAGNGSFLNHLEQMNSSVPTVEDRQQVLKAVKKIGLDILPEHPNILQYDFFDYQPPVEAKKILVIGNPPFGKVSSIAVRFFNHAANWASVIAFIIPRTFRRPSIQNKLQSQFHLLYDMDVPQNPCCFTPKMMVKCCFQIWEKRSELRLIIELPKVHPDWTFLSFGPNDEKNQPTPPIHADFAIRAYGGKIGEIQEHDLMLLRPKSWHWIKSNIDTQELISRFRQLDYSNSTNTARQNSMGRGELVQAYCTVYEK